MKTLLNTQWLSLDGRIFDVVDQQGDWVWYTRNGLTYSCLTGAFQQRFTLLENQQYDRR
jgi:hypothetical protein